MRPSGWFVITLIACGTLGAQTLSKSAIREATAVAAAVLDDWHLAAARFEEERYFNHMAPEAVFVGLDEHERWSKAEFRKWAHGGFQAHQIWDFKATHRNMVLSSSGDVAWFDELLDAANMGRARGTGVLVKDGKTWLIAQYALSLPIPRESFAEVRQLIQIQKPSDVVKEPNAVRPQK